MVVALTLASCGGDEDAQGSAGAAYGGGAGSEGMAVGGTAGGGGSGGGGDAGSGGAAGSSGAGATAGQGGAPTQPRNVNWELAFETGQLAPKSDGGPDSASLRQSTPGASLVITSISKESPARVSYAGADPAELQGLLIQGVKGMTEVNGLLVRPKKVDAVAHEFRAYLDHEPGGTNPDQTLGTVALDATGFSQYAGGGSLTAFIQDDTLKGGAGPGSGKNCRVTSSDKVGAETVLPREGKYFFRSELHYSYDYAQFVGNSGKNKPRLTLAPPPSVDFDWDDERYAAWSIYIPSDFEDEFATNNNVRDNMVMNIAAPGADTQMSINIRTPSGEKTAHWVVLYYLHPTSTGEGGATQTVVDLGPIAKGKWTDFVLRHRWNPFSTPTNASKHGGVDRVFAGNRGILQLWYGAKAQLELGIDLVNAPVGLVPRDWKKEPLSYSWRQYKYAWHHHTTNVAGPIWIGFDAIREGSTGTDGTEFDDVHPAQASCEAATVAKALCP